MAYGCCVKSRLQENTREAERHAVGQGRGGVLQNWGMGTETMLSARVSDRRQNLGIF